MSPRKKSSNPYEIILLGFFLENPLHGYDLYKIISQPGGISDIWHVNQSNLYAMLDNLEENGYLISHLMQIGNTPVRKEYHITHAGTARFEKWIVEPVMHGRDMRQMFLAKLFFAVRDKPDTALRLVTTQKSIANAWKSSILENMRELTIEDEYDRLVFASRLRQIDAWLDWLDECMSSQIINRNASVSA